MARDLWLPRGFQFADGSVLQSLKASSSEWQIFKTNGGEHVLLAGTVLAQKWVGAGFLDSSLFCDILFGSVTIRSLQSPETYALAPVNAGATPTSKMDALAFATALKESRKRSSCVSFHDAIYVEQYSRLLPSWTLTPHVDDEFVLGTWLTGGVFISTKSYRRLTDLTGWMTPEDLAEIADAAGVEAPSFGYKLTGVESSTRSQRNQFGGPDSFPTSTGQIPSENTESRVFRLPGRPELEHFFNEYIIDIIFNLEKYRPLGIQFPSAVVLHGPPGCGKTYAVEQLVNFIDWPSFSIDSKSIGSPYIHETSKKIAEVFEAAISAAPSVIVIDEMEAFLSDRKLNISSSVHQVEEVAEFLRRIPEAIEKRVLVLAMTNRIDFIDPAVLRRGRFDHVLSIGMPSKTEVAAVLDSLLKKLPTADPLDLGGSIEVLDGKPLSDSAFAVREAARLAARCGKTQLDLALRNILEDSAKRARNPQSFQDP